MYAATLLTCMVLSAGPWSGQETRSVGYLWNFEKTEACLYTPQEGDIILTTSKDKIYTVLYFLGRSDHPYHSTIVVRRTTGELEMLECGGGPTNTCTLRLLPERLTSLFQDYHKKNPAAWIRRRTTPLTADQSARLTTLAESQVGKVFTPRNEFLSLVFPRGRLYRSGDVDQPNFFCAELIIMAIEQAQLLPAGAIPNPGRITPLELFQDRMIDLREHWGPPLRWTGDRTPPPRWPQQPLP